MLILQENHRLANIIRSESRREYLKPSTKKYDKHIEYSGIPRISQSIAVSCPQTQSINGDSIATLRI